MKFSSQQPAQERDGLGDLVRVVARGARARALDHLADAQPHGRVVADDVADVLDRRADRVLERRELLGAERPVELEVHDRLGRARVARVLDRDDPPPAVALDADDRVDDADDPEAAALELGADRVDEERQVVGVRLEHRAPRAVAVLGRDGVERAHGDRRAVAARRQLEGAERLAEQRLGARVGDLVGEAAHVLAHERADRRRAVVLDALVDERQDPVEDGRSGLWSVVDHTHGAIIARDAAPCRAVSVSARSGSGRS